MSNVLFNDRSHTVDPDVFTASSEYATRFSGEIGEYFLETQWRAVQHLLNRFPERPLKIIEVGGGHLQITERLISLGHSVTVHGSNAQSLDRLSKSAIANQVTSEICGLSELHSIKQRFDLAIALRLIPHCENTVDKLASIAELSEFGIIFDYASTRGLNGLAPFLFQVKRKIEQNTRPFFNHSPKYMNTNLRALGFNHIWEVGQFVLPMGLHRKINSAQVSKILETPMEFFRINQLLGNPVIVGAAR